MNDAARQPRRLLTGAANAVVTVFIVVAAACGGNPTGDAQGSGGNRSQAGDSGGAGSPSHEAAAGERTGAAGFAARDDAGAGSGGGAASDAGGAGGMETAPADATACVRLGSTSSGPCLSSEAFVGGKCVPCTATGDDCMNLGCTDCCTRLGVEDVCTECTDAGETCKTAGCYDCCSGVAADGVCLAECTSLGSTCLASTCSDCCAGRLGHLLGKPGVGADGVCAECLSNADCACPSACVNHACQCTDDGGRCLSADCSDCCSGHHAANRCSAVAPECTGDDTCGPDEQCIGGECTSFPMAAGGGGG